MDISLTLNPSYPAGKPVSQNAERSAAAASFIEPARDLKKPEAQKRDDLVSAVEKLDKYVNASQRNLSFSIDEDSGKVVVKVIATATGEVIRQLPSAEALKLAEKLDADTARLFHAKV